MAFNTGTFSVAIPVYRRQAILPFTIQRWLNMNVNVVCVCSTDSDAKFLRRFEGDIEVLHAPNSPLSDKWNKGFKRASEMADYVIFAGSTDWIHSDYLKRVLNKPKADYWGSLGCSWLEVYRDDRQPYVSHWPGYAQMGDEHNPGGLRTHETIGIGRVIRSVCVRDMFELTQGVFHAGLDSSLDNSMRKNLLRVSNAATKLPLTEKVIPTTHYELLSLSCPDVWQNKHRVCDTDPFSETGCFDTLLTYYPEAKTLAENVKSCPIEK